MAIVIFKRPSDQNWSGNPIPYHLYSAAAEANAAIYFEIKLMFKRTDAADFSEILRFPWNPYKGTAKMDLCYIIDSLLEYEVPIIPDNNEYDSPTLSQKATGLFYINWREITPGDAPPGFTTTETVNAKFVIKGGIAYYKWRGDNFWVNYYATVKPFLTWQESGRDAGIDERMYLTWLNLDAIDPGKIVMRRKVVFTDGTNYTFDYPFPVSQNYIGYFPTGATQLKLDLIDPDKKIYYWELQVWNTDDDIPLSQIFRYLLDNAPDYNAITLNYRDSIGGLSSARVLGVIEYSLKREFIEIGLIARFDYFAGHYIDGRSKAANSTELLIYKGNIGHLRKEQQDRLRDIHLQREVWWEIEKKWIPLMTMTGDQNLKSTEDMRFDMPIEFSIASGGDRFYTPDKISLGAGDYPSIILCDAVISVPVAIGLSINWLLVSGAPVKYFVSTPAVSGGAPHESTLLNYTFDWLPVGDNVIKVQPVCKIGDEFILGVPQYVTITVAGVCTPVAFSGSLALPAAEIGTPYDRVIALTGTAPFTLSNVTKPGWMLLAIEEITPGNWGVHITGTPTDGYGGWGYPVSFTITNCGGPFVNYSQVMNVGPGTIQITNDMTGWRITNVTPPFYAIQFGAFPINLSELILGSHSGYNGVISVVVASTGGFNCHLKLTHNGALIESLPVTAAGTYAFTARNFITGDYIQIELTL